LAARKSVRGRRKWDPPALLFAMPSAAARPDPPVLRLTLEGRTLRVYRPNRFWERHLGLLVRPPLRPEEALWLDPCGSIHTGGMRYDLDVAFLDFEQRILAVRRGVRPWRVILAPAGTCSALEFPAGGAGGLSAGRRLALEP